MEVVLVIVVVMVVGSGDNCDSGDGWCDSG